MKDYYAEEIARLRDLGQQYAEAHPSVAPMLASRSTDPDVERILEGTAFLCGLIHERLDQNFPEIVQGLLEFTAPQALLPTPSATIVQFIPDASVSGVQTAHTGTELQSIAVNGSHCNYTLFQDLDIYPIVSSTTTLERDSVNGSGRLHLRLVSSVPLDIWLPDSLTFYIHDNYPSACDWLYQLIGQCDGVHAEVNGQRRSLPAPRPALQPYQLPSELAGTSWAFGENHSLLNCPHLARFFTLPEQFLFLRLNGLEACRSDRSEIEFVFDLPVLPETLANPPDTLLRPNTCPAHNVFRHTADPFVLSHARQEYRLNPQNDAHRHMEIYAIAGMKGIRRGGGIREFRPYNIHTANAQGENTYTLRRARSQATGRREFFVSLPYKSLDDIRENETLSTELLCYHHTLPAMLHAGDICVPTDSSPAMATFTNLIPPSTPIPAVSDNSMLWKLFSCLHANMLPLASVDALREFLQLYIPQTNLDPARQQQCRTIIEGIRGFSSTPEERLMQGRPIRGQLLRLTLSRSSFVSTGEMVLLAHILDKVLAGFSTVNNYTRLVMTDSESGERIEWPARLGIRQLL